MSGRDERSVGSVVFSQRANFDYTGSAVITPAILYQTPSELSYLIGPKAASACRESSSFNRHHRARSVSGRNGRGSFRTGVGKMGSQRRCHVDDRAVRGADSAAAMGALAASAGGAAHLGHGIGLGLALPPRNLFSLALFGQMLVGALSGLEYIAIFAGESQQPERNITRSVWLASPIICAMFILGALAQLCSLPSRDSLTSFAPIPQTLQTASRRFRGGKFNGRRRDCPVGVDDLGHRKLSLHRQHAVTDGGGLGQSFPCVGPRAYMHNGRTAVNSILCSSGLVMTLVVLGSLRSWCRRSVSSAFQR